MNKNIKKAVVGLVAFNVVASTMITMAPTQSKAAEPIAIKTIKATTKPEEVVKSSLKATSTNLIKNGSFQVNAATGAINNWYYYNATDKQLITNNGSPNIAGGGGVIFNLPLTQLTVVYAPNNFAALAGDSSLPRKSYVDRTFYIAQAVNTVPGKTYRFIVGAYYDVNNRLGGATDIAISNDSTFTDISKSYSIHDNNTIRTFDFVAEKSTTYIGLGNNTFSTSYPEMTQVLYNNPSLVQVASAPSISNITSQDTSVTVTGEPNARITITLPDSSEMSKIADASGKVTFTIPKQDAGDTITAVQTSDGETSSPTTVKVTLKAPSISLVNDKSTSVTVTGDPSSEITITLPDGTRTTKTANAQGQATFNVSGLVADQVIQASQSKNGQTSSLASTTVQATALNAPTIAPFTTADTQLVVTGEAGARISVKLPDGSDMNRTAGADGKATFNIGKQDVGVVIEATQTGTNGKTSSPASIKVTQGVVAPPTINPVTTDSTIVTGTGIAGASVKVRANNIDYTGTVKEDGTYSISIPKQTVGTVITETQTLNNVTSSSVSATVTQGTLAAPTINDYYATAGYVTGTAPAGASKIALYIDNTLVRYGAVDSNGKYQIYAADNAKMNTAGTAFQVVAIDANGNMGTKANATVKAKIVAPSINDYYTTDVYAKGTATGASKVTLYINGKAARTAAVNANGSYSIYTGDQASLTTAGATFQISATNTAGLESTKTTGTVKSKLAAPVINKYVATDAYARGTASAGSKQVVLYVDGKAVRTANVNANGTYAIYTGDQVKLTTAGNTFQISSKDAAGNESPKATGTVLSVLAAPVIAPYYTSDVYATGTTTGAATKVALYVDGKFVRYATVTDGKYSIYTGDQAMLRTAGNTFQIAAVDANGIIGSMTKGTVLVDNRVDSKLTANDYNLAVDQSVTGEAGKDITRVKIYVNGELKRQTNVADGAYSIYAKDVITKASDEVVIVGYDTQGYERNRVSVPVNNEAPKTYNLTANEYNLAKDKNVTGTSDTGITRVQLVVNDVVVRATATANGSYEIYAEDKIKLGDKVEIVGLDSSNIARKTVAVSVVNNTPVAKNITVDDYTIGTDNITGTFDPEIKKVQLFVDGSFIRQAAISGTSFTTYAADKVTSKSQTVEMVGFDTSGAEIARQAVNVK